jgi:hypothetical protein
MKLRQAAKQFVMRRGYMSVYWRLCEGGRGLYPYGKWLLVTLLMKHKNLYSERPKPYLFLSAVRN